MVENVNPERLPEALEAIETALAAIEAEIGAIKADPEANNSLLIDYLFHITIDAEALWGPKVQLDLYWVWEIYKDDSDVRCIAIKAKEVELLEALLELFEQNLPNDMNAQALVQRRKTAKQIYQDSQESF